MMKKSFFKNAVLTCSNHQELDKKTIKKYIPGYKLMENAGKAIFVIIQKQFKKTKRIKIICGPGNNGGDAFVVGRLLKINGFKNIGLYCSVSKNKLNGDAKVAANKWDGEIKKFKDFNVNSEDLVIDGLFGSGLKKKIIGINKKVINQINSKKTHCISIDIPSGINGDTGQVQGVAIKSKQTITFTNKKPGHLLIPGSEYCGNIFIIDIGINLKKLSFKPVIFQNHPDNWIDKFPWPTPRSHKYSRGYTLIICGDKMTGASRLAARGTARIGCGLLCLGVPSKCFEIYSTENPIAIVEKIETEEDLSKILKDKRINTILVGPGLGISKKKLKLILKVIKEKKRIVVLDADALKNNFKRIISNKKSKTIVTPHEGEFLHILKSLKIDNMKQNKLATAIKFVKKSKSYLVLKGNRTIICSPKGKIAINTNSSPFLATGGSGDVLAGMITGLLSQGMPIFKACCAAVWIHGEISKIKGPGLISEDIPEIIPNILKRLKSYRVH